MLFRNNKAPRRRWRIKCHGKSEEWQSGKRYEKKEVLQKWGRMAVCNFTNYIFFTFKFVFFPLCKSPSFVVVLLQSSLTALLLDCISPVCCYIFFHSQSLVLWLCCSLRSRDFRVTRSINISVYYVLTTGRPHGWCLPAVLLPVMCISPY